MLRPVNILGVTAPFVNASLPSPFTKRLLLPESSESEFVTQFIHSRSEDLPGNFSRHSPEVTSEAMQHTPEGEAGNGWWQAIATISRYDCVSVHGDNGPMHFRTGNPECSARPGAR